MSALPDPEALDAMATRIAVHAQAARNRATVLNGVVVALTWRGVAAGVFDDRAAEIVSGLRIAADRLDDAAAALHRHAAAIRDALRVLVRLEHAIAETGVDVGGAALHAAPTALHLLQDVGALTTGPLGGVAHLLGID